MFQQLPTILGVKVFHIFIDVPFDILSKRIEKRNASDWPLKNTIEQLRKTTQLLQEFKPKIDYTINGNQETEKIVQEILKIVN